MKKDIVLVEDDLMLGQVLSDYLQCNNLSVFWAKNGISGLKYFKEFHPKLLILDVILPDITGLELLEEIKKSSIGVPVILMTGTEFSVESQVKAYNLGAINYIKKPVIPEVLLAQINQLLLDKQIKNYQLGKTSVQIDNQLLIVNDKTIKLREKEAKLMVLLLDNKNRLVTRDEVLRCLWYDDNPKRNSQLDNLIFRLKKELAKIPGIKIDTVYGTGYTVGLV